MCSTATHTQHSYCPYKNVNKPALHNKDMNTYMRAHTRRQSVAKFSNIRMIMFVFV